MSVFYCFEIEQKTIERWKFPHLSYKRNNLTTFLNELLCIDLAVSTK